MDPFVPSFAHTPRSGASDLPEVTARQAHREMIRKGAMWQDVDAEIGLDTCAPIEKLAERNAHILDRKLGGLDDAEQRFYNRTMDQPWFITHFSSTHVFQNRIQRPHHQIVLKSHAQRERESPNNQAFTNAAACDVSEFAGTDFVYLCVELGRRLKKTQTRSSGDGSGTTVIRTPLHQPSTSNAMSMHADIFDGLRVGSRLGLSYPERSQIDRHLRRFEEEPMNDDNGFARTVFHGPTMIKDATTRQVILDMRKLSPPTRSQLLERSSSGDLNSIISSFSRTQVMVPKEFSTSDYSIYQI